MRGKYWIVGCMVLTLLCMAVLPGCLEKDNTTDETVRVSLFIDEADWWSPGTLHFEKPGLKKVIASFSTGPEPTYLRFFKLNKTITPPWIEIVGLQEKIESTKYQNTSEERFTVIMTEWPQTNGGMVYIKYDAYSIRHNFFIKLFY